ncbi:hypothetical protein [Arthrobacter sp. LAPM80]|uniref:hypothetical protein n=1 Tax=Arthrobacter sp. LAPM80 TaxID=3141788 RepID=UPI00398B1B36
MLVVILAQFAMTTTSQPATVAALFLTGGFGFAPVPGLRMRVMKYASSAPTLASGANIGAFNLGNALGARLGGVTITEDLGYTSPIFSGAALTLLAVSVMAYAAASGRKQDRTNETTAVVQVPPQGWRARTCSSPPRCGSATSICT